MIRTWINSQFSCHFSFQLRAAQKAQNVCTQRFRFLWSQSLSSYAANLTFNFWSSALSLVTPSWYRFINGLPHIHISLSFQYDWNGEITKRVSKFLKQWRFLVALPKWLGVNYSDALNCGGSKTISTALARSYLGFQQTPNSGHE